MRKLFNHRPRTANRVAALAAVAAIAGSVTLPGAAQAASVAYVDGGGIWVSKLDGSRKVMLADASSVPVDAGPFREVTAADSGRIVGVRRPPNHGGQYSWFQVFEPDGSSTVQNSLGKTGSWSIYAYPTALDITADGHTLAYGHANSSCCPYSFDWGTYVLSISAAAAGPFDISGQRDPSLVGNRIVSTQDNNITYLQNVGTAPFSDDFTQWSDAFTGALASGYEMGRTDVAANGTLAAGEFVKWESGSSTRLDGGVFVYSIASPGGAPTGALGCDLPAQGIASDVSISQDAKLIAWRDDGGVKVASAPTGQVEQPDGAKICTLGSAPVVISPTGTMPSIGGADVDVLRPPPAPPATTGGGTGSGGSGTAPGTETTAPSGASAAPAFTAPARIGSAALARGLAVTIRVDAAGPVTLTATVPAARMGRKGKPVIVATGRAVANAAGNVTVRLKLNSTGRKKLKRLKGARLTLTARHGGRRSTKTLLVRPTASADRSTPAAHAAAAKKKKVPLTATVNGTFVVREDNPAGFGYDEGPNWQQLTVVIKDAKIPFRAPNRQSAAATVNVRFEYTAEAHTQDRSYAAGCDSEDRETYGGWSDKTTVTVRETHWLQKNGKSKKYLGWQVIATPPENGIYTVSKGSYQEWDSILMEDCNTVEANKPLGSWSTGFATPDGLGKLSSDNRSVPLTAINTEIDQKGTVTGSVKFNKSVAR
jgi:hypothetical protein